MVTPLAHRSHRDQHLILVFLFAVLSSHGYHCLALISTMSCLLLGFEKKNEKAASDQSKRPSTGWWTILTFQLQQHFNKLVHMGEAMYFRKINGSSDGDNLGVKLLASKVKDSEIISTKSRSDMTSSASGIMELPM